jgi:hypothetical protein
MPTYRIQGPDGRILIIEGPEGSTPEQALEFVKSQAATRNAAIAETKQEIFSPLQAGVIGAGRRADKIAQGVKQAGLGTLAAAKAGTGIGDPKEQLQGLAAMRDAEAEKDRLYAPLAEKHPFATGLGETVPALAIPGGQATTAARILAPAAGMAAMGAASYGTPTERLQRGVTDGIFGLGGGVVGEGVRRGIAPAQSSLNSIQQQAVRNASEKLGIQPRPSQLTGNQNLARVEDYLARMPGSAGVMEDLASANKANVNRVAARAIGENSDNLGEDVLRSAADRLSGTYDTLRANAVMPVGQPIFDAVSKAEIMLTKGSTKGKEGALSMIQELKDTLYQNKQLDGEAYQAWVRDLSAEARATNNRTISAALREVEKAMDKAARGADAKLWAKTDKEYAALETLTKQYAVNNGDVNPVKVAQLMEGQFGKNLKTGKVSGPMVDIANYGRAMPPLRQGSQTAERQAVGNPVSWAAAPINWLAAKAITSRAGADYLSGGLLANPRASGFLADISQRGMVPLTIAELEALGLTN